LDHARELALPSFAPLPGPMVLHLLLGKRRNLPRAAHPALGSAFERETGYTQAEWDHVLRLVQTARHNVFTRMDPLIRRDGLTTTWLLQALSEASPRMAEQPPEIITQSTLKEWKNRGFISNTRRNHPDAHQAAALLIARLVDDRKRNWLPRRLRADEAHSWCWRQDGPGLAPVPYPIPLLADLPKATLLISAWSGRGWDSDWTPINSLGAARWAGVIVGGQQANWDLSPDDLRAWDPQVAALLAQAPTSPALLQRLADIALIRLAWTQLAPQQR
jgi:hypothetical protein